MESVRISRVAGLRPRYRARLRAAQRDVAQVWMLCRDIHLSARQNHTSWPTQYAFQRATKVRCALHSQTTMQAIWRTFLGAIDTTHQRRRATSKIHPSYKDKRHHYPLLCWPAQAVSRRRGGAMLSVERGQPSLVLPIGLPAQSGACNGVWQDGSEL